MDERVLDEFADFEPLEQLLGLGLSGMKPAPKVPGTGYSTPGGNVGVNTNWSFPDA